jgi:hypothetical protein
MEFELDHGSSIKCARKNGGRDERINKLTAQVVDDTLDRSLGETADQPFVGSDLLRGTTSHAVLAQVGHLRMPPFNQHSAATSLPGFDWRSSMPRDLFVHNNLSTVFVHLDDRITPTQLRFNMSQLARNFCLDWITPYERLI